MYIFVYTQFGGRGGANPLRGARQAPRDLSPSEVQMANLMANLGHGYMAGFQLGRSAWQQFPAPPHMPPARGRGYGPFVPQYSPRDVQPGQQQGAFKREHRKVLESAIDIPEYDSDGAGTSSDIPLPPSYAAPGLEERSLLGVETCP